MFHFEIAEKKIAAQRPRTDEELIVETAARDREYSRGWHYRTIPPVGRDVLGIHDANQLAAREHLIELRAEPRGSGEKR